MKTRSFLVGAALCSAAFLSACSARRPVLYPNDQYNRVGKDVAEQDVAECMRKADAYVESGVVEADSAKKVGTSTAVGAAGGAAVGAVGGAVGGNVGEGAAVGAATGATAGLLHGLFGVGSSGPDPVYANFVDRCLREKGYEPIGWK